METKIITLNAVQARALAYWVSEYAAKVGMVDIDGNKTATFADPKYGDCAMLYDYILQVRDELNPPKIRIAEEA